MAQKDEERYDREVDPEVIARRHKLFNEWVLPSVKFVDYLCVKYASDPKNITSFKYSCLIHLYRAIESFDPSKYKDKTNPARAWQNWCHLVCKRLIQSLEEKNYEEESLRSGHVDIEDSNLWDTDGVALDTENTDVVITIQNYRQLMEDRFLYAFEHLDIIQKESFILQHQGMTIAEIHKDQVAKGRISPNTGCDAIKKRMQRGRVILNKYMAEYDEFAKRKVVKETKGSLPDDNKDDEFDLKF